MKNGDSSIIELMHEAATCFNAGDLLGAQLACERLIEIEPGHPDALNVLAVIARANKKWGRAEEIAKEAFAVNPNSARLANTLGLIFLDQRRLNEAIESFETAIGLNDQHSGYLSNLGSALQADAQWETAKDAFSRALVIDPIFRAALIGRASVATDMGVFEEAVADLALAKKSGPPDPAVETGFAKLFLAQGNLDAAYKAFDAAVALTEHVADAKVNRGLIRMMQGRIQDGWEDYASRRWRRWSRSASRYSHIHPWKGENLAGKSILIWCEQGLGEAILCASLINKLIAEAERVTVEVDARLVSLFERSFPAVEVVAQGTEAIDEDNSIDIQAPIFELIGYRSSNALTQAPGAAFLWPDEDQKEAFAMEYRTLGGDNPLVGISWGSPAAATARQKSLPIDIFEPILRIPDVTFVNLQYGPARHEIAGIAQSVGANLITDSTIDLDGSLDSPAAQIAALDLVITVTNSTAHLAGALGKETWVLVPPLGLGSMWYWFTDIDKSPWYESVTLMRRTLGADTQFMSQVTRRLKAWVDRRSK